MAKRNGLGQALYLGNFSIGGAVQSYSTKGGPALIDVTTIDKSAMERIGGRRDGGLDALVIFDDEATTGSHDVLSALPTEDLAAILALGTSVGSEAFMMLAKQADYPLARDADGKLSANVSLLANGGAYWGEMLTAGVRTESSATNGASVDGAASSSFGLTAVCIVTGLTSGSPTVKIQDSADNSSFADVSGATFGVVTASTNTLISTATGATVRRYVRVVTTGTFSGLSFVVAFIRHPVSTI